MDVVGGFVCCCSGGAVLLLLLLTMERVGDDGASEAGGLCG